MATTESARVDWLQCVRLNDFSSDQQSSKEDGDMWIGLASTIANIDSSQRQFKVDVRGGNKHIGHLAEASGSKQAIKHLPREGVTG
eukprot:gene5008-34793_t